MDGLDQWVASLLCCHRGRAEGQYLKLSGTTGPSGSPSSSADSPELPHVAHPNGTTRGDIYSDSPYKQGTC